jgi:hypothetical protein
MNNYSIIRNDSKTWERNTTYSKNFTELQLERSKKYAITSIDAIVNNLQNFKGKVVSSKLSDENKAIVISEIDSNITWFENKKMEIESAKTITEVKDIGKAVDRQWNVIIVGLKKESGLLACDEMDEWITEAYKVSNMLSEKIKDAKAQGKNTWYMERRLNDYNNKIKKAERLTIEAREQYTKISTPLNADLYFASGTQKLKAASNELTGAYGIVKEVYRLIYGNKIKVNST